MQQPPDPTAHARSARQQLEQLADAVEATATAAGTYVLLAEATDVLTCLHRILTRLAVLHRDTTGLTDPTGDPATGRQLAATLTDQLRRTTEGLAAADVPLRRACTVAGQLLHSHQTTPSPPPPRPSSARRDGMIGPSLGH